MGRPKHLLETPGGTLLEHIVRRLSPMFFETLLVGRGVDGVPKGIRSVEDMRLVRSPLIGIYSGLRAASTETNFVIACDMPFVRPDLIRVLLEESGHADVVVPLVGGFYEPLCAVYRRSCIPAIDRALDDGRLKVTSFYCDVAVQEMPERAVRKIDPDLQSFTNLNTPKQLALLAQL